MAIDFRLIISYFKAVLCFIFFQTFFLGLNTIYNENNLLFVKGFED